MLRLIQDACARLWNDRRGNVFILFAASSIPLMLVMGGAVDFSRYARYKTELANSVDAAALALARNGEDYTEDEATAFVEDYVESLTVGDDAFTVQGFDVDKTENGYIVEADGSMDTMFLPLGAFTEAGTGIMSMGIDIVAEVVHASNRVELALVFDNTGSMNCGAVMSGSCASDWSSPSSSSRIVGLKSAAQTLVNTLMTDEATSTGMIKVALVPFEGAVNVKNASLDYSWLDWQDVPQAKYNGVNFNDIVTTTCSSGLWDRMPTYASLGWVPELAGFDSMAAIGRLTGLAASSLFGDGLGDYGAGSGLFAWHWGGGGGGGCTSVTTTQQISHKWLFDQLNAENSSVQWEGCVEMRAEPYDVLDTTPDASTPDTLFVPFFWPDEPDSDNDNGDNYQNNYLEDITTSNGSSAQRYSEKYQTSSVDWHGSPDTSSPFLSGPNYGCPRPILPLTTNKASVTAAINSMVAYPAMGTYIPTGLVWGWHVLTSNAPFTEGVAPEDDKFETTVKAMVLLTDGENWVLDSNNHNESYFSGYNYTGTQVDGESRLGSTNPSVAETNLNAKTSTLCTNVKNAGIRLYTITFGNIPAAAKTLMQNCASVEDGVALYYDAPSNSELQDIFYAIGEDLSDIHLAM